MIFATAGHIDHGKTRLVRSLTNKDTDTLPEEKKRGMSIDLGFAYADLGDGDITGFIDVPGHEKFVHTMVAGIGCIDLAILVVALDDGPMPQTLEHIKILELLGINKVAVAFTKLDLVSDIRARAVKDRFFELAKGTFFENAPSVFVSNDNGIGILDLKKVLANLKKSIRAKPNSGCFRMAIDRRFSLPGIGKVVTGSVFSGEISIGDTVMHLPSKTMIKIRNLRVQDEPATRSKTGDRCALNISGSNLGKIELSRGDWIVDSEIDNLSKNLIVEVPAKLFKGKSKNLSVHFHLASQRTTGKIFVLKPLEIDAEYKFAKVTLKKNIHAVRGDRFIIRDQSARHTIGGGIVIDPMPDLSEMSSKKRKRIFYSSIRSIESLFDIMLRENVTGINSDIFRRKLNLRDKEFKKIISGRSLVHLSLKNCPVVIDQKNYENICLQVIAALESLHASSPAKSDFHIGEIFEVTQQYLEFDKQLFLSVLLKKLEENNIIENRQNQYALKNHIPKRDNDNQSKIDQLNSCFGRKFDQIYTINQLSDRTKIANSEISAFLKERVRLGEVVRISDKRYCSIDLIAEAKKICSVLAEQNSNNSFTVADFKNNSLLGRNQAIELLEYLDKSNVTLRVNNARILRKNRG